MVDLVYSAGGTSGYAPTTPSRLNATNGMGYIDASHIRKLTTGPSQVRIIALRNGCQEVRIRRSLRTGQYHRLQTEYHSCCHYTIHQTIQSGRLSAGQTGVSVSIGLRRTGTLQQYLVADARCFFCNYACKLTLKEDSCIDRMYANVQDAAY